MAIKLFNSLTKTKEEFIPLHPNNISMYVCGPTVYDRPHIGNARSAVIYDLFFRLFSKTFPQVTYVRNITDVDDKINQAAKERNISIHELTAEITKYYHQDMTELKVLPPTIEPKATQHIPQMIAMIENLIADNYAYESDGNVLFDVNSYKDYGHLSNRSLEDMIAGSRVEVASYKKDPLDFVLWKPALKNDDPSSVFDSPWGKGRPGWHIECSAMSSKYLGADFDIHGGGADLQFPHHENEIAQSRCANKNSTYARYWIHNGFLTASGEKMSKSLKNFITVRDLLDKKIPGIVIRYLLLSSHYRKPLDYNDKALFDAEKSIEKFYSVISNYSSSQRKLGSPAAPEIPAFAGMTSGGARMTINNKFLDEIIATLSDDLNTPLAFATLHELAKSAKNNNDLIPNLIECLDFLGLYDEEYLQQKSLSKNLNIDENYILEQIKLRKKAKAEKNWKLSDEIRNDLLKKGIILEDKSGGEVHWHKSK